MSDGRNDVGDLLLLLLLFLSLVCIFANISFQLPACLRLLLFRRVERGFH